MGQVRGREGLWRAPVLLYLALLGLVATACHETVKLTPPSLPAGTRSVVMVARGGSGPAVWALDLPTARGATLAWPDLRVTPDTQLDFLAFGCATASVGLKLGPQRLTGTATRSYLPVPAAAFHLRPAVETAPRAASTTLAADLSAVLGRLELGPDDLCKSTAARYRALELTRAETDAVPAFAAPISEHASLLGDQGGNDFIVDDRGGVTPVSISVTTRTSTSTGWIRAAHMDVRDGSLWVLTSRGQLAHGRLGSTFEVVSSHPPLISTADPCFVDLATLAGPDDPAAPFELFALNSNRVFARYADGAWSTIATQDPGPVDGLCSTTLSALYFLPMIAWAGPGHALAVGFTGSSVSGVIRYRSDRSTPIYDDLSLRGPASVLLRRPGLGLLAGAYYYGPVFLDRGQGWNEIKRGGLQLNTLDTIAVSEGGFILGGFASCNLYAYTFFAYDRDAGYCALGPLVAQALTVLAPVGTRGAAFIAAGPQPPICGLGTKAWLLTETRRRAPCSRLSTTAGTP